MIVSDAVTKKSVLWSPTPGNHAGDLQMVMLWATRGFVVGTPKDGFFLTEEGPASG